MAHRWLTFLDQTPAQRAVEKMLRNVADIPPVEPPPERYRILQQGHLNIVECRPMQPGELNFADCTYKPWKQPFDLDKAWEDAVRRIKKEREPYVYVRPEGKQFIQLRICCDNRSMTGMVHACLPGRDDHTAVGWARVVSDWGV